jgi:carbonic anhydrase/acetyltransferase-like protein (isoleucine patch superfamily)
MRNLRPWRGTLPTLGARVYVDPAATVIGDVVIGDDSSVWFGSTVRGDVDRIVIGRNTNIQDNCAVHVTGGRFVTTIGDHVTIGHGAIVHACTIGNGALVGMGATVMDGVVVEDHGYVGAGALVTPGKVVRSRELWLGNPAKMVRVLDDAAVEGLLYSAAHYVRLKDEYLAAG